MQILIHNCKYTISVKSQEVNPTSIYLYNYITVYVIRKNNYCEITKTFIKLHNII